MWISWLSSGAHIACSTSASTNMQNNFTSPPPRTVDTSVSVARWQQGEQAVASVGIVFLYPLCSALAPRLNSSTSLMMDKWAPLMSRAVLITRRRAFLSWAVHILCQFVMFPVRLFYIVTDKNLAREFSFLSFLKNKGSFQVFFNRVEMWDDRGSSLVMLINRKIKIFTCSTLLATVA